MAKLAVAVASSTEDRHEQFAQEYLIDLNATAAYQRVYLDAGPSSAAVNAHHLLRNAKVAARIAELKAERASRMHLEQDRTVRQLLDILESDVRKAFDENNEPLPLGELDDRTRNALANYSTRRTVLADGTVVTSTSIRFWDKLAAAKLLMQHHGMLIEKHELSGPAGGRIQVVDPEERIRRMAEMMAQAARRNESERARTAKNEAIEPSPSRVDWSAALDDHLVGRRSRQRGGR